MSTTEQHQPDPAREQAYADLMRHLRRALVERRQVVSLDDVHQVRFQRRGEMWDHGEHTIQALQSGVFVLLPVERGGVRVDGKWLHYGSTDDLEDTMKGLLSRHDARELEGLAMSICANEVLQSLNRSPRTAAPRP